jgi:hypothetical protein
MIRIGIGCLFVVAFGLMPAGNALATNYYWNVSSGDWTNANNWNPVGLPTSDDYAYLANGGTIDITGNAACSRLYVQSNTNNTINHITNVLTVTSYIYAASGFRVKHHNILWL